MTGPLQISGRGDLALDERVRLELDYIEHYSPAKDLNNLLKRFTPLFLPYTYSYWPRVPLFRCSF